MAKKYDKKYNNDNLKNAAWVKSHSKLHTKFVFPLGFITHCLVLIVGHCMSHVLPSCTKRKKKKSMWELMEFAVVRGAHHVTGCPSLRLSAVPVSLLLTLAHLCTRTAALLPHDLNTLLPPRPTTFFSPLHPASDTTKDVGVLKLCRVSRAPAGPPHSCSHR